MSEKKEMIELKDGELEKAIGGITEGRALDEKEERNCQVYIQNADGTFSWVNGRFIPDYTGGGVANVRVGNEILSVLLGNIDFDFKH